MVISVNGERVGDADLAVVQQHPLDGGWDTDRVAGPDGTEQTVRYRYAFTGTVISSADMRGFVVYVRGKAAQAPPFFFQVEGTRPANTRRAT